MEEKKEDKYSDFKAESSLKKKRERPTMPDTETNQVGEIISP